jgi:hypothetical protein
MMTEKQWWSTKDVAAYLSLIFNRELSEPTTRMWMQRHNVRRAKGDRRMTTKAWVDQAIDGKCSK